MILTHCLMKDFQVAREAFESRELVLQDEVDHLRRSLQEIEVQRREAADAARLQINESSSQEDL